MGEEWFKNASKKPNEILSERDANFDGKMITSIWGGGKKYTHGNAQLSKGAAENEDLGFALAVRTGNADCSLIGIEAVFEAMRIKLKIDYKHAVTIFFIKYQSGIGVEGICPSRAETAGWGSEKVDPSLQTTGTDWSGQLKTGGLQANYVTLL